MFELLLMASVLSDLLSISVFALQLRVLDGSVAWELNFLSASWSSITSHFFFILHNSFISGIPNTAGPLPGTKITTIVH